MFFSLQILWLLLELQLFYPLKVSLIHVLFIETNVTVEKSLGVTNQIVLLYFLFDFRWTCGHSTTRTLHSGRINPLNQVNYGTLGCFIERCVVHFADSRVSSSGKCYKVPEGLDDGGKRKRKRPASLQDFRSWYRGTCKKFYLEGFSSCDKMMVFVVNELNSLIFLLQLILRSTS